ncbi:DUF4339 domain-containing protein [Humisphaera borealis]|uniref:DUF4339 domain-containing protein n=1 Tax=Humisphaera borealis TaxID=2807512 RepID=A0A7M2WXU7_9BACT|nr:DUF4339 domain-containing protein [Humisphaera borealis]QOV89340.1 DUF4339 domain-containing protein [Humisphaera borealis]
MASLWFCRIHGLERGPITWDMLQELAQAGDLRPSDLVRRGDQSQWVTASQARFEEPIPGPPPLAAPIETKLTARLAAALAVDVDIAHAPARPYRRVSQSNAAEPFETASAEEVDVAVSDNAATDTLEVHRTGVPESAEAPTAADSVTRRLPAKAAAHAVRSARPRNPGGVALLALGLALIGLFKLALPLGLLSMYLGWTSAGDLWRRPNGRGTVPTGVGLATAVAAMVMAGIDIGVSLYYIVT